MFVYRVIKYIHNKKRLLTDQFKSPKELNNLEPPQILNKIWHKFKSVHPFDKVCGDIDDFFRLKTNPIYPERPYFKHEKVHSVYNMLNSLGYYPDSKVHKERRFVAAMSDNSHASMASFCNVLLSRDENFVKKVTAAYEYLELPTIVIHVNVNYE